MTEELQRLKDLAIRAGAILLEHYSRPTSVHWKGINDPVTDADRAAGDFLVEELGRAFPADGIVCEENADDSLRLTKSRVWMIDPMDGTKEFIARCGEFAVMVGLAIDGAACAGVVYQPVSEKLYWAAPGNGAFLEDHGNRKPLQVSAEAEFSKMTMAVSRSHPSRRVDVVRQRLGVPQTLSSGSIGLKIGLLCEGDAHLYIHTSGKTFQWDTCAPEAILREAGGVMTDLFNNPLVYNSVELRNLNGVVASNGVVHEAIIEALRQREGGN
jgi:3'(2'), 5'-bisphosphate nucleotidase